MSKSGLSERRFTTLSGVEVEPFYEAPPPEELPPPGEFPYTRGIHRDMYRGKLWTMRLFTDTIEFGARHTPRFNPISISGYHIREAGSTAVQELAFTLRDGVEYVEWA